MANDVTHPIPTSSWRQPLAPSAGPDDLQAVRQIAWLMDSAISIPGTRFKVGLDALIGLVPGFGDAVGMLVGSYLVMIGARAGVPRAVLLRMVANVGVDAAVGAVPLVGDVLDVAWRANAKNARLLEQALTEPERTRRSSVWTLVGLVLAVVLIGVAGFAVAVWLAVLLVRYAG